MDNNVTVAAPLIQTSPALGNLAGALAKAQAAYNVIRRSREVTVATRTGGKYTFNYAPLDTVLDAVGPALSANGLSVTQELSGTRDAGFLTTTLMHESGEWRASTLQLPGSASTAQEFGSQVTYARRYAIQCVLGVAAEEDDDANAADGNEVHAAKAKPRPRLDAKTQARIKIMQGEAGIEDREWREKLEYHYGVSSSAELSPEQAQDLIRRLGEVLRTRAATASQANTVTSKSEGQG